MSVPTPSTVSPTPAATHYHEQFGLPSFDSHIFLVYGYGSILWKQEFDYEAEYETYIKGYTRVFYQGSRDHRGVPGKPGRVVTLLHSADKEERVYGKAYQLPADPEKLNKIFNDLDVREQGGYERVCVTLYDAHPPVAGEADHELRLAEKGVDTQGKAVVCLCYRATEDNDDYLGPDTTEAMARQILNTEGNSGPNREYLFRLADCLHEMGAEDQHVFDLAQLARQLEVECPP